MSRRPRALLRAALAGAALAAAWGWTPAPRCIARPAWARGRGFLSADLRRGHCSALRQVSLRATSTARRREAVPRLRGTAAADDDARVRAATEAWLDEWVIGLKLCPWAQLTRGAAPTGAPHTRICVLRGGEGRLRAHAAEVQLAADELRQRAGDSSDLARRAAFAPSPSAFATTLLVFPDAAYRGHGPPDASCGAFPVSGLPAHVRASRITHTRRVFTNTFPPCIVSGRGRVRERERERRPRVCCV